MFKRWEKNIFTIYEWSEIRNVKISTTKGNTKQTEKKGFFKR